MQSELCGWGEARINSEQNAPVHSHSSCLTSSLVSITLLAYCQMSRLRSSAGGPKHGTRAVPDPKSFSMAKICKERRGHTVSSCLHRCPHVLLPVQCSCTRSRVSLPRGLVSLPSCFA